MAQIACFQCNGNGYVYIPSTGWHNVIVGGHGKIAIVHMYDGESHTAITTTGTSLVVDVRSYLELVIESDGLVDVVIFKCRRPRRHRNG